MKTKKVRISQENHIDEQIFNWNLKLKKKNSVTREY